MNDPHGLVFFTQLIAAALVGGAVGVCVSLIMRALNDRS